MLSLSKMSIAMRDHQHPWNLRRIFGRQTVVWVGSPKWPEAGIAALVITSAVSARSPDSGARSADAYGVALTCSATMGAAVTVPGGDLYIEWRDDDLRGS